MRCHSRITISVAIVGFVCLSDNSVGAQRSAERSFDKVREIAERGEATKTLADDRALGAEVARYSIALHFASNGEKPSEASVTALGDTLGELQQSWRANGDKGIPEAKLTKHTSTFGNPGAYLAIKDDGGLVVYSSGGAQLWSR